MSMIAISYRRSNKSIWAPPYYMKEQNWNDAKTQLKRLEVLHGKGNAKLEIVNDIAMSYGRKDHDD